MLRRLGHAHALVKLHAIGGSRLLQLENKTNIHVLEQICKKEESVNLSCTPCCIEVTSVKQGMMTRRA
jgi:hypothetical protein